MLCDVLLFAAEHHCEESILFLMEVVLVHHCEENTLLLMEASNLFLATATATTTTTTTHATIQGGWVPGPPFRASTGPSRAYQPYIRGGHEPTRTVHGQVCTTFQSIEQHFTASHSIPQHRAAEQTQKNYQHTKTSVRQPL